MHLKLVKLIICNSGMHCGISCGISACMLLTPLELLTPLQLVHLPIVYLVSFLDRTFMVAFRRGFFVMCVTV